MDPMPDAAGVVELLARTRTALLDYYQALGGFIPDHRRKWLQLAVEVEGQQVTVAKLRAAVAARSLDWVVQPFTVQVPTFLTGELQRQAAEVKAGKLNRRYAVSLLAEAEQSLVDAKLYDALRSNDAVLSNLLYQMKSEAAAHSVALRGMAAGFPA